MCVSSTKTVRVRVDGFVQGVGFRAFVVRRAAELGVRGWVMNAPDGAVEIEAQADPRKLERFMLDLKRGPRMARVEDVSIDSAQDPFDYETFEIRW